MNLKPPSMLLKSFYGWSTLAWWEQQWKLSGNMQRNQSRTAPIVF